LLFGGDATWTKTEVTDFGHLTEKIKKHEKFPKHIRNASNLALLRKVNIATPLSEAYVSSSNKHNEEVRKKHIRTVKNN
jgi:hypothetical protein